jgi:outer membrane protein assembly factor BamB
VTPAPSRQYTVYDMPRPARRAVRLAGAALFLSLVVVLAVGAYALANRVPSWLGETYSAPPPATAPVTEVPVGSQPSEATTTTEAVRESPVPGTLPMNTSFAGLTMFRGNGHRSYYGEGPVPRDPRVLWRFPEGRPMQSHSSEGGESRLWAGTGWTGQPVVFERDGRVQVMFGAYDRAVHFIDGESGTRLLPDLVTGDIIKGSVAVDPDGYPLLYTGSRDNYFRVVALDRGEPEVLWKLSADSVARPVWNNDWDSSPVIVGDYLFEGGENSYFFIIRLNRGYGGDGKVSVEPEVVLAWPAYTDELIRKVGDRRMSIENSPAVHLDAERGDRVYFANGGGRVVGLDISALGLSAAGWRAAGQAPEGAGTPPARPEPRGDLEFPVVFDFWAGDDIDASIVIDDEGALYVAAELERHLPRAKEVGQLMKLDPYREGDPLVWSVHDRRADTAGIWATPALHGDLLYVPTHTGRLLGVDKNTGDVVWEKPFTYHAWGSPAVVDDTLIVGDTEGRLRAYDVSDPRSDPPELWQVQVPSGGALESTPAVWRGRIYVGSRDGYFYAFGDE